MAFWGGTQRRTRQLFEVTVDRCYELDDTEPFATEYSCVLIYGDSTKRTRPCFGKGTHPVFDEKFVFELSEQVVELNIQVLANKPPRNDQVIGSLSVQLQPPPSDGYVDSTLTLQGSDGRPAGYMRLTLQFPSSSCRLERQESYYPMSTMDYTAPQEANSTQCPIYSGPQEANSTQRPILYQLLPYDALPPPRPTQPNGLGSAALWSQFLPYSPPPSAAPVSAYNPFTAPPAGYPLPQYQMHPPPPGPVPSNVYWPPPR